MLKQFLIFILYITLSQAKVPGEETIKGWLNQSDFNITDSESIYLPDNERAYLVKVHFNGEQRILKQGLVLVRPEYDEAAFIPGFAMEYEITDLDHDGISEIIYNSKQDFPTYTLYKRFIIQLHDYKIFELYSSSHTKQKACNLCLIENIEWEFDDLTGNKIKDLREHYQLSLETGKQSLVLKEKIQEIEFNKKGFNLPMRPKPLTLNQLEIAKDVIDRTPIMPTQAFKLSEDKVFCFLDFTDVLQEETVTYHWYHESLGEVISVEQKVHPAKRFRTWVYKSLHNKQEYLGHWRVIITDRYNRILGSKEFTISASEENPSLTETVNP